MAVSTAMPRCDRGERPADDEVRDEIGIQRL
jgi:hypothetical protein